MSRFLLSSAALLALCICPLSQAADKPLSQGGKKTLFQRVLTTPGCKTSPTAGSAAGDAQPVFSRFMCERAKRQTRMAESRPRQHSKTIGWLRMAATDWKMQLTLAFTNPANRDRLLFFKDRATVEGISMRGPGKQSRAAAGHAEKGPTAPGVLLKNLKLRRPASSSTCCRCSWREVMTSGFHAPAQRRVGGKPDDKNAKGGAANSAAGGKEAEEKKANQLKEFSAAVVFVIDSTISMDPYIDRTREAIRKVYQRIEAQNLGKQVKFGLVAFRSNTQAVPGLEYTTKMYADPTQVKDSADFFAKIADLKQATVSSSSFDEDSFAGVMESIDKVDWSQFGARYVVLITDAGAIEGDDKLSKTGLSAAQVRIEAANPGVAIYTLHLKTPAGAKDHAKAEAQYQNLSTYPGTNTSLYYPVNAGDIHEFGRKVDALAAAITTQVKAAYMGEDAIGSAANAKQDPAEKKMLEDAALIGHAMQLAYLGEKTNSKAPPVFKAWITDRDLIKQNIPTTDVRVLLTKSQLSDLSDVMKQILDAANEGLISPTEMFDRLRSVAATMGADPNQLKQNSNAKLADMGVLGEYLADLPYQSEVLNLDEETWKSWDGLAQEKFIRTLNTKLRHYQRYNADVDRWVALAKDSDARDNVYPVPLEMMP
jgi:hypothetical protein